MLGIVNNGVEFRRCVCLVHSLGYVCKLVACDFVGVTRASVQRAIKRGEIKHHELIYMGRKYEFLSLESLIEYTTRVNKRKQNTAA